MKNILYFFVFVILFMLVSNSANTSPSTKKIENNLGIGTGAIWKYEKNIRCSLSGDQDDECKNECRENYEFITKEKVIKSCSGKINSTEQFQWTLTDLSKEGNKINKILKFTDSNNNEKIYKIIMHNDGCQMALFYLPSDINSKEVGWQFKKDVMHGCK